MQDDIKRESIRHENELRALHLEKELVAAALASKSRQLSGGTGGTGRAGQVSRDQVLDILRRRFLNLPFNAGELSRAFAAEGTTVTPSAAKQHLRRLESAGLIGRDGSRWLYAAGRSESATPYGPSGPDQASPNGDGRREEGRDLSAGVGA